MLANGKSPDVDVVPATGPPTVPRKEGLIVAVVKELSPSLADWNTTPSVALGAELCWTVCTSAALAVVESDGVAIKGVGLEAGEVAVEGMGPAIRTAEDVGDDETASSVEDVDEDSVG